MKYSIPSQKNVFPIYVATMSVLFAFSVFAIVASIADNNPWYLVSLVVPFTMLWLTFLAGEKLIKTVEFYEDKIVFIPLVMRRKKETIFIKDVVRVRVLEELGLGYIQHTYEIDVQGMESHWIHPYRFKSTPESDKIVAEFFNGKVPFVFVS